MKIVLHLKPLSVNKAYQGRRFSTPEKKSYDAALALLLPRKKLEVAYYRITYRFFLTQFALTDQQNLLKILTDGLVRHGIIRDDRYVIEEHIYKRPSTADRIELEIEESYLETP